MNASASTKAAVLSLIVLYAVMFSLISDRLVAGFISNINIPSIQRIYQPSIDVCVKNHLEAQNSGSTTAPSGGSLTSQQALHSSVAAAENMCGKKAVVDIVSSTMHTAFVLGSFLLSASVIFFRVFKKQIKRNEKISFLKPLGYLNLLAVLSGGSFVLLSGYLLFLLSTEPEPAVKFVHAMLFAGRFSTFYLIAVVSGAVMAIVSNFVSGTPEQGMVTS